MAHPAIPRLPVWRLHLMREEAKRRVARTMEEHRAALAYEMAVDRAIAERESEQIAQQWKARASQPGPDVRGWIAPTRCPPAAEVPEHDDRT